MKHARLNDSLYILAFRLQQIRKLVMWCIKKAPEKRRKGFDYFPFDNPIMNMLNGEPELKMN